MPRPFGLQKLALTAALFVAFVVGSALTVKADPFTLTNGSSVTVTYMTSNPNVTATAVYSLSGNVLTIQVTNTSTVPSGQGVITAFGFSSNPNIAVGSSSHSGEGVGWTYGTTGGGLGGLEHRFSVSGVGNGLNAGESVTATMNLTSSPASLVIDPNQLHIQAIPPQGGSEKPNGTVSTLPEPATMFLLGFGLLGGVAEIRRRRRKLGR